MTPPQQFPKEDKNLRVNFNLLRKVMVDFYMGYIDEIEFDKKWDKILLRLKNIVEKIPSENAEYKEYFENKFYKYFEEIELQKEEFEKLKKSKISRRKFLPNFLGLLGLITLSPKVLKKVFSSA